MDPIKISETSGLFLYIEIDNPTRNALRIQCFVQRDYNAVCVCF